MRVISADFRLVLKQEAEPDRSLYLVSGAQTTKLADQVPAFRR